MVKDDSHFPMLADFEALRSYIAEWEREGEELVSLFGPDQAPAFLPYIHALHAMDSTSAVWQRAELVQLIRTHLARAGNLVHELFVETVGNDLLRGNLPHILKSPSVDPKLTLAWEAGLAHDCLSLHFVFKIVEQAQIDADLAKRVANSILNDSKQQVQSVAEERLEAAFLDELQTEADELSPLLPNLF
jgi:hypothetical protein